MGGQCGWRGLTRGLEPKYVRVPVRGAIVGVLWGCGRQWSAGVGKREWGVRRGGMRSRRGEGEKGKVRALSVTVATRTSPQKD